MQCSLARANSLEIFFEKLMLEFLLKNPQPVNNDSVVKPVKNSWKPNAVVSKGYFNFTREARNYCLVWVNCPCKLIHVLVTAELCDDYSHEKLKHEKLKHEKLPCHRRSSIIWPKLQNWLQISMFWGIQDFLGIYVLRFWYFFQAGQNRDTQQLKLNE